MLSALSFIMSRNVLALRAASSDQGHFLAFAAVRTRTFAEQSSPQSKACRHRHALVGSGMGSGGLWSKEGIGMAATIVVVEPASPRESELKAGLPTALVLHQLYTRG